MGPVINGLILEKDGSNMTEELRNKFAPQLEQRKRKRAQRARVEKRREKRIKVEENKLMGKYPGLPKSLRIESDFHFPMVGITSGEKINNSFGMRSSSESIGDSGSSRNASPRFNQSQNTEHEMKEYS